MNQVIARFAMYQPVKVVDKEYERAGQVGVYVGPAPDAGEVLLKFENESGVATDPQQIDSFPVDALEGM